MSVADSGGFDIAVEINRTALLRALTAGLGLRVAPRPFQLPNIRGTVVPQVRIINVGLSVTNDVTVVVSIDGTILDVSEATFFPTPGPLPDALRRVKIDGTVSIVDRLEIAGTALVVDFRDDAATGQPQVVPAIDERSVLSSPLVMIYLVSRLVFGQAAYEQAKVELLAMIEEGVRAAVREAVINLGVLTLVPAPASPSFAITGAALQTRAESLHLLYTVGGAPGDPTAITRSMLLTSTSTGLPLDVAAICLSNAFLLRDVLRPALVGRLGLPPARFVAGHPCFSLGSVPFVPPGGLPSGVAGVTVDSIIAGTDEANLLHIITSVTAIGAGGTFTYRATVDASFVLGVTVAGGVLTFTATLAGTPAVPSSDVEIPAWVYVISGLLGGALLVSVLAAIDLFAGGLIAGPLGAGVAAAFPPLGFPVPLPTAIPSLALRPPPSLNQADAPRRIVSLPVPVLPFPLPFPDPFRAHDFITNYV